MATTYTPIATTTLGSAQTSVTFSSIPATYTDLILVYSGTNSAQDVYVQVNGDTGTNYSTTILTGNGTTASSLRYSSATKFNVDSNGIPGSTTPNTSLIHFMNYSNTTTYKTILVRTSNATYGTDAVVGLWRSTSAINQISLSNASSYNWSSGSTFSLYGIKAA